MSDQPTLFEEAGKSQVFVTVPITALEHSEFNPRKTRDPKHIHGIAKSMTELGYQKYRAMHAYPANRSVSGKPVSYFVFAGGNRLEAAKQAGIEDVPILLHTGYSNDEIVRMADIDNELDGLHNPVGPADVWAHYKYLKEIGWKGTQIAEAKNVGAAMVSYRLQLSEMPDAFRGYFFTSDILNEGIAREFLNLHNCEDLEPWLDFETLLVEIIENRLRITRAPTAKQFRKDIEEVNAAIWKAEDLMADFPAAFQVDFLGRLAEATARTEATVHRVYTDALRAYQDKLSEDEEKARAKVDKAERERLENQRRLERQAKLNWKMAQMVHGDARDHEIPEGTSLLLTDPPYGIEIEFNRRTDREKPKPINNDGQDDALRLLEEVLTNAYPRMAENSSALIFTGWVNEPEFRQIVQKAGFNIRNVIIWNKPNHGVGDLYGGFAPKYEMIIFAVKGNPKLTPGVPRPLDVLEGNERIDTEHPTDKPLDLLSLLIEVLTTPGEIVADPFMGSGTSMIAAAKLNRNFWGCELEEGWHREAAQRVYQVIESE